MNGLITVDSREFAIELGVCYRLIHVSFITLSLFVLLDIHQTLLQVLLHFTLGLMIIQLIISLVLTFNLRIEVLG